MARIGQTIGKIAGRLGLAGPAMRLGLPQGAVILMYHGVTADGESSGDWEGKHVPASLFRTQVQTLCRYRKIVPLQELVEGLIRGRDVRRLAALTFDDGYLNNSAVAAPVLRELGVPATFFVATGFLDERRWLWNDRLENALHRTRAKGIAEEPGAAFRLLETMEQRRQYLREKKRALKQLSWREAEARVERLEMQLDLEPAIPSGLHEFMTWKDAKRMSELGFCIGAHTVNHALLSRIPVEEARLEILASRDRVFQMIGRCNPVFCYPNGKRTDYNEVVMDFCRDHFLAALSAEPGLAHARNLFELRRVAVDRNATPSALAREILRAQ